MAAKHVLAFDLGGTKIASALVDSQGHISKRRQIPTPNSGNESEFLNCLTELGDKVKGDTPIESIGIGSAGPLDPLNGVLIHPTNIKLNNKAGLLNLTTPLEKHFNSPCLMENDAAAAILGEQWIGSAKNFDSGLILTLGTGVGIGAIVEGKLQRCRNHFHPEISHMILEENEFAQCGCGNTGCIEALLSGENFPKYLFRTGKIGTEISGKDLVAKATAGETPYLECFEVYAKFMARALQNLVLVYSPEVIIFSGSFSAAFSLFEKSCQKLLEDYLKMRRDGLDLLPQLKLSTISENSCLLGAARVAWNSPGRF